MKNALTTKTLSMFLPVLILLLTVSVDAKVSVMFHPYDPTLATIASLIREAKHSVNIAMYNIDGDKGNPVVAQILSPETQARLQGGELTIRMIYQGYDTPEGNAERMRKLESMGIDVRVVSSGKNMHHKFAVIDIESGSPTLISGSANWSRSSHDHYSENILFFDNEPGLATTFYQQFFFLWTTGKEYGEATSPELVAVADRDMEAGLNVDFNTANFKLSKSGQIVTDRSQLGFYLTRSIVAAIDEANSHVRIATTRIKLRPIYDAILRAAARGVKVDIVVTMGEFESLYQRQKSKLGVCEDSFDRTCSSSKNFAAFLSEEDFPGRENVDVRFKFFSLNHEAYLNKQMHSKYIIIDDARVLTGSFNWSISGEFEHIENLLHVDGAAHPEVVASFVHDFERLYELNRDHLPELVYTLEEKLKTSTKIACGFEPIAMTTTEIDDLLNLPKRHGQSLRKVCK